MQGFESRCYDPAAARQMLSWQIQVWYALSQPQKRPVRLTESRRATRPSSTAAPLVLLRHADIDARRASSTNNQIARRHEALHVDGEAGKSLCAHQLSHFQPALQHYVGNKLVSKSARQLHFAAWPGKRQPNDKAT